MPILFKRIQRQEIKRLTSLQCLTYIWKTEGSSTDMGADCELSWVPHARDNGGLSYRKTHTSSSHSSNSRPAADSTGIGLPDPQLKILLVFDTNFLSIRALIEQHRDVKSVFTAESRYDSKSLECHEKLKFRVVTRRKTALGSNKIVDLNSNKWFKIVEYAF